MIIRLKDGSEKEYAQPMSVLDIAKDISEGLARNACAGEVDGETVDLRTVLDKDCELNILTFQDDKGKLAFRKAQLFPARAPSIFPHSPRRLRLPVHHKAIQN